MQAESAFWRVTGSTDVYQKDCLCFTHPTFMRALCSKPLGLRIVFLASGVAGGDMDRLISSREGPWGELGRAAVDTQEWPLL